MRTLEFDKILEMLAELAPTEGSRAYALTLPPQSDPYVIKKRLKNTTDAKRLIVAKGFPSFGSVNDVVDSVERAEKGATLSTRELLDIAALLRTARRLIDYYFDNRGEVSDGESLRESFGRLVSVRTLED